MDLMLVVVFVFGYGVVKMVMSGRFKQHDVPIMNEDGSITFSEDDLPIGNNLTLRREPGAFTLILKELGLM